MSQPEFPQSHCFFFFVFFCLFVFFLFFLFFRFVRFTVASGIFLKKTLSITYRPLVFAISLRKRLFPKYFRQFILNFFLWRPDFSKGSSLLSLKTGLFQREVASREESSIWTNRLCVKQDFVKRKKRIIWTQLYDGYFLPKFSLLPTPTTHPTLRFAPKTFQTNATPVTGDDLVDEGRWFGGNTWRYSVGFAGMVFDGFFYWKNGSTLDLV